MNWLSRLLGRKETPEPAPSPVIPTVAPSFKRKSGPPLQKKTYPHPITIETLTKLNALTEGSRLTGQTFARDPRFAEYREHYQDLGLALKAVTEYLEANGFTSFAWRFSTDGIGSARLSNGRRVEFTSKPDIEPHIVGILDEKEYGYYVKVTRDPNTPVEWTKREILTLQQYRVNRSITLFLAPITLLPADDPTGADAAFQVDYRGAELLPHIDNPFIGLPHVLYPDEA